MGGLRRGGLGIRERLRGSIVCLHSAVELVSLGDQIGTEAMGGDDGRWAFLTVGK